jgi:glycine/serine hydroxymethyltransferase
MIIRILTNIDNPKIKKGVREEVSQMCSRFPVPGIDD